MRKIILITVVLLGLISWRFLVSRVATYENSESTAHKLEGPENRHTSDSQTEKTQEKRQTPTDTKKEKFQIVLDGRIATLPAVGKGIESMRPSISSTVTTDEGIQENTPNGIGIFPEVKMKKGTKARVRLAMEPNADAILQVLDGGRMNDSVDVLEIRTDARGFAEFEYSPELNEGTYRIAIDNGGEKKFLYFTVG